MDPRIFGGGLRTDQRIDKIFYNTENAKVVTSACFFDTHFYVPALALQATMHSCTRQKGRKDSDGRVQDVGLRIPECP